MYRIFSKLTLLAPFCVMLVSCGSGEGSFNLDIPDVRGPKVKITENNLLISMVFENITAGSGLRYSIPKYPNSQIQISPDLHSSGAHMVLQLAKKDLLATPLAKMAPQYLPGGRPLPGVDLLPMIGFSVEQFRHIAIYQGQKQLAIWIPLQSLNLKDNILSASYYNNNQKLGELSLVGEDKNGENSGMLLSINLSHR